MNPGIHALTACLSLLPFAATVAAAADTIAPPPIRRVVLYQHGIGYFEREGEVDGDATLRLRFRAEEMEDVLKSLAALDMGGGSIDAIAYDSKKPAAMQLADFGFDLRSERMIETLVTIFRGARVAAEVAGRGTVTGRMLGLESETVSVSGKEMHHRLLTLLDDETGWIAVRVADVKSLRFLDPKVASRMHDFLEVLRSTHRREEKTLDLVCRGTGARDVFVAYTVEQPTWKTSYRLVLQDGQSPWIQGWAIVDNTSNEDWTDVRLSLVAGQPISFRLDLYTPEYRERPWYHPMPGFGLPTSGASGFLVGLGKKVTMDDELDSFAAPVDRGDDSRRAQIAGELRQIESQATARDVGELLEYAIDHPVTIPRLRSAMLPILGGAVAGERVAYYREASLASNPFSALRITNSTGLALEDGPVTVLENGTLVGEAWLEVMRPEEVRIIPFAIDQGVKATTKFDTRSEHVHKVTFGSGYLVETRTRRETKTYSFHDKSEKPRRILVEHPRRAGLLLESPAQPFETELDLYRFALDVAPGAMAQLAVVESQPLETRIAIASLEDDAIGKMIATGELDEKALAFLREVVERRQRIRGIETVLRGHDAEIAAISEDEARLRENLAVLADSSEEKDLRRAYVDRLARNEARLAELKQAGDSARRAATNERAALAAFVDVFALADALPGRK
jgi:hypothetical protein